MEYTTSHPQQPVVFANHSNKNYSSSNVKPAAQWEKPSISGNIESAIRHTQPSNRWENIGEYRNDQQRAKCTYYGIPGHSIEVCYKKNGYPPGWILKSQRRVNYASNDIASSSHTNMDAVRFSDNHAAVESAPPGLGLTALQLQKLCALLDSMGTDDKGKHVVNQVSTMVASFQQNNQEQQGIPYTLGFLILVPQIMWPIPFTCSIVLEECMEFMLPCLMVILLVSHI